MKSPVAFVPPSFDLVDANSFTARLRDDRSGFARLAERLADMSGIHLPTSEKNLSLMAGRLGPILRTRDLPHYTAYDALLAVASRDLREEFVSALTTNTTEFFREAAHFDFLAKLAAVDFKKSAELRIWCAACSSGQEVWTILMTLHEAFGGNVPMIKLLATDIDREVLAKAATGTFTEHEMQSVPPLYKQKYFQHGLQQGRKVWRVNAALANGVSFAPFNLTADAYPFKHPFDVVFCRNVLIYFDKQTVQSVLTKLSATLRPGGHMFLGHSESGQLRNDAMASVAAAVYKRKE